MHLFLSTERQKLKASSYFDQGWGFFIVALDPSDHSPLLVFSKKQTLYDILASIFLHAPSHSSLYDNHLRCLADPLMFHREYHMMLI